MNLSGFKQVKLKEQPFNLIAFEVVDKLTTDDMHYFNLKLEQITKSGKKALVYVDLTTYEGFEIGVVFEKLSHFDTIWSGIGRCAYIVNRDSLSNIIGLIDVVTPMHLKAFNDTQIEEAQNWLFEKDNQKAFA